MPILIFIFISVFGVHHFSLKTYYPKLDERGEVVYNAAGDTVFQTVPYFDFVSQQGDSLSQTDLDSTIYVISFFEPSCPNPCQDLLSKLKRVHDAYENIPQVKFVSISVSQQQDSLQLLQQLSNRFEAQPERWYFLTGSPAERADFREAVTIGMSGDSTVADSGARIILVDKQKQVRGIYDGTGNKEIDRLKLEINVLLDDYSKRK
ncbi:SCO family protein [Pontibacter akesuensis]|uniref:SCO family protein n=1 Tax=Pontibacter akesuensis TaxID=388950 RepID=UPI00155F6667|nr:SCO family protein [Pontibacter akesuensis]